MSRSHNIQVQRSSSPTTNSSTSTRTFSSYSTNTFDNQGAGELFIRPVQNETTTQTTTKSSGLFSNHHADKIVPSSTVKNTSVSRDALSNLDGEVKNSSVVVATPPTWLNDGQNVPISYEIVTKPDGKKEFQLRLDAKSFNPEDLNVKVENDNLVIEGNHEEKSASGCVSVKSFTRRCNIPSGVKPEDLNCSLDSSGRLMITAPVFEAPPPVNTITTKTITYEPIYHAGPREQIITVYQDSGTVPVGRTSSTTTSSKTVRTFKTLS
ncbi:Protein lethal(2)essential for life [Orchesella cincta]|uniref:Protein lethal(2)essential for life n=1 Tax=Orchesella cincta TaxID=48709 RepID=A0A1D2NFL4_ORCCI|nr:Protein lethal(2)essential for life [Orchesella cincta]